MEWKWWPAEQQQLPNACGPSGRFFMQTYKHVTAPSCGGLGIDCISTLSIKERQLRLIGDVTTDKEAQQLLVFADLKSKSRLKEAKESIAIRR